MEGGDENASKVDIAQVLLCWQPVHENLYSKTSQESGLYPNNTFQVLGSSNYYMARLWLYSPHACSLF